jgi:beta-galactosidase
MVLDLIGYNYHHKEYKDFPSLFPGEKFIATETGSSLATRGHYSMPSDSIRIWPYRWDMPFTNGDPDNTVSAYDNVRAPWGSTQEEVWKVIKKYDFLTGMYIWTGFDYLGEPTPYGWPSRSSYFGLIDLAGFPKDTYYMYKSEWTEDPVLHVFPHWNWNIGDTIDIWAYFNCDEVELFLNGESQGTKRKEGEELHVSWRLPFSPGTLKAVGKTKGKEVLTQTIHTAGKPAKILLTADRKNIAADGKDLSFVTVEILDANGNLVPDADNMVKFEIDGEAFIAAVDNGCQTSHEPFKANYRKAFNGKCLAVIQSNNSPGNITLKARSDGLDEAELNIKAH